jgi:hypothetical protein
MYRERSGAIDITMRYIGVNIFFQINFHISSPSNELLNIDGLTLYTDTFLSFSPSYSSLKCTQNNNEKKQQQELNVLSVTKVAILSMEIRSLYSLDYLSVLLL